MKSVSNQKLHLIKAHVCAFLESVNYGAEWIAKLKEDFRQDNDLAFNTLMLANYISWHMRHNGIHLGEGEDSVLADYHAGQAVMYALNEIVGEPEVTTDNEVEAFANDNAIESQAFENYAFIANCVKDDDMDDEELQGIMDDIYDK